MAMKTVPLGTATIGPQNWKNSTIKDIKLSQTVVGRSDKNCDIGRVQDPLPHLRETLIELSNVEAHRYFREARAVVGRLRESLLETNEEIKSLTRGRESLEKALEHKRKDLQLNRESSEIRTTRPSREKDTDGADDLLSAERQHLLNLKRVLEAQLRLVQQQLQVLDNARKRLATCLQERSRVLDLICHAMKSQSANANRNTRNTLFKSTSGSLSARADRNGSGMSASGSKTARDMTVDPLGSYSPEADQALHEARDARQRSQMLRIDLNEAIEKTERLQKAAHKSVNDGLIQKIAETETLRQHLSVSAGENRHAIHRAQRWFDTTEKARNISLGPVSSSDLVNRERLNRPIIRVFQRHPGNQLPEAQQVIQGGNGLLESLTATSQNIGLLKLAHLRLKDNLRDKRIAQDIDSSVVRLRRNKSGHRWSMGATV
ncbi:tektin-like protein 1 [Tubulanus polymorphus]|uniref:tektin-like protein 1 n=1 Tax=Tubulanus polymorphus TaxID=672921 RepID=UPI003DA2C50E